MSLRAILLPKEYNYIACFLTLDCNLKCAYCINSFGGGSKHQKKIISGKEWIRGLNRLVCPDNLPLTFQGGEPSRHPDFIWIIKNIKEDFKIDILTNLSFDIKKFIKDIAPSRLSRNAPYPNIRVSYHPYYSDFKKLIKKVLIVQKAGFSIGIFSVIHPGFKSEISEAKKKCLDLGVDFRTKEFLGEFKGKLFGTYLYPEAVGNINRKKCICRTSELIIGPNANIYRCHHDLYKDCAPVGDLLKSSYKIRNIFRKCNDFGDCNPCDIKIKTDRFQRYGHTSVEIKGIRSFT